MNENLIKLEKWYESIKMYPQLSFKNAKELNESLLINSDDNKRDYLITGTLYVIYKFIKKSGLLAVKSASFDIDDIIGCCCEAWINIIDNNRLLNVHSFGNLEYYFYKNIKNTLANIELNNMLPLVDNFGDILKWFIEQKNKEIEVSYNDFLDYIFLEFDIIPEPNNKYVNLYNTVTRIYEMCYTNKNLVLNKTQLDNLKYLLIYCVIHKSYFEETNTTYEDKFTNETDSKIINALIREYIFEESHLSKIERQVIYQRYGFDDNGYKTLDQTGAIFNLSSSSISQIELKALRKLNHPSRSWKLKEFVNKKLNDIEKSIKINHIKR